MRFFSVLLAFVYANLAVYSDQVVPVTPSLQNNASQVSIVLPKKGFVDKDGNVWVQVRVRGIPIGIKTIGSRADEVANVKMGQSLHIIVDNYPYFARVETKVAPYDEEGNYYEDMYKFKIPFSLAKGKHYLRVFAARSYGEAYKGENCFDTSYFYIDQKEDNYEVDLSAPYLTYNEPSGYIKLKEGQPVLLDFLLSNCNLSNDGYKLKLTFDGKVQKIITDYVPYYIYGLKKGSHTIRLELIDQNNKKVKGDFNDVQRNFTIE